MASDRVRALLDARSVALARPAVADAAVRTRPYLVCAIGAGRVGIEAEQVASVLPGRRCTPLPEAGAGVAGIVALSGVITTVIALEVALGLPAAGLGDGHHLVRLRPRPAEIALAVDRVLAIVAVDPVRLRAPGSGAHGLGRAEISGYAPPGSGAGSEEGLAILDLPRLLARFLP